MRKSLEYKLLYALGVAKANPDARILFACGTKASANTAWAMLLELVGKPNGFSYKLIQREARHDDGGVLMVRCLEEPTVISGMQVTHAWVDELCNPSTRRYVQGRVRCPAATRAKLKEPMGLYDDYGVHRTEDY